MKPLESIKTLVQVLVVIIVLAVFLEMLLPNNQMHSYVKMVMGLMVVVLVLETAAGLIKQDFKLEVPVLSRTSAGVDKILADGQKLAGDQKQQALAEYRRGIEKQVLALAKLNHGLNVTGAQVKVSSDPADGDYGRLIGIVLEVTPDQAAGNEGDANSVRPVQQVEVTVGAVDPANQSPAGKSLDSKKAKELAQTVANFYNLPVDRVQVVLREK
ncbi:Sporulation stage III protein AF [Desulfotomaculum nigrificans CO-1-SRB]|uniref:Sporulation stage III protein AF n=1 Tax=Desulfotomaculum nigrificans (strain DSM 14880 / VKM B-2319 / CO-1-SRB) TaxID=868595 RepID=F6B9Z0_DESCC|nr:stage III sporulation protein AF [Desulfotomaculum nigrificans]AEF94959.1 Sporulation stage III protein AF [Desulfotomaculum nigrificans CO-1-SRB]